MRRYTYVLMIALALAGFFIPGCSERPEGGASGSGKKQISFVTMQLKPTFDDYFNKIIAEFEAKHPDVKIKWDDFPYDGYDTKVMTSLIGPQPPDVVNIPQEAVQNYVTADLLLPLDGLLTEEQLDDYVPQLLDEAATIDGKLYALPWYAATDLLLVNKNLWAKAGLTEADYPKTQQDIRHIAQVFKEKTDAFGYFPFYTEGGSLKGYLLDAGIPLFAEDYSKATFNTPLGVEVLKFWTDLYKDDLVPKESLTATHRRPIELFKSGRLAILPTGPQFIRQIKGDAPDIYNNLGIVPHLNWPGADRIGVSVHMVAVSKKSRNPELAAEFAAMVTNDRNQLEFCKLTTIFPSTTEALKDHYFSKGDDSPEGRSRVIGAEQLMKSTIYQPPPKTNEVNKIFNRTMEAVALGQKSAEEALKEAEEQVNEVLKK